MTNQVRLNHELLIWVGFTLSNGVWSYPDGVTVDNGVPYFPESLDAIFKWLVPKMEYVSLANGINADGSIYYCSLAQFAGRDLAEEEYDKDPAVSLCLAIQKLIRSK